MLESEVRDGIAEREQPVVVTIVVRAEDRRRLVDEPSILRREIVRRLRGLGALRDKVQRVPVRRVTDQIDLPQRLPELYRRVDDGGERGGLEMNLVAGARSRLERGRVQPAGRNAQRRIDLDHI